ncbi:B12-binding domain-containing protein [Streptomyces bohaiensis]|uniref:B12-binding domain-containing protein n=1 Tax=Streptomyces bohaiensis TaxID=1431344 RepID=UPI003B7C2186
MPVATADATDDWFPLPFPLPEAGGRADGGWQHRYAGAPAPSPGLPPAVRAPALPAPAPGSAGDRRVTGRGASGAPGPTGTGTLRAAEARTDTTSAGERTAPTPPGAVRGDRRAGTPDPSPHGTARTEGGGRAVPAARRPVATRTVDRSARSTVPARSTEPTRGTGTPARPAAPQTGPLPHGSPSTTQRLRSLGAHAHPAEPRHATAPEDDEAPPRPRPEWRGLAHAATRLDGPAVEHLLDLALARQGLITAWEEVIAPALHTVGRKWAMEGEPYVGVEHLLSWHVSSAFRRLPTAPPRTGTPPLLLTCVADEHHTLPIEALAAALGQRGIPTRVFGPAMPADALVGAVRRLGPAGVVLWAQARETADRALVGHLLGVGWGQRGARTRPAVHLAGPGWAGAAVAGATRLTGLRSAVDLLDRTTP